MGRINCRLSYRKWQKLVKANQLRIVQRMALAGFFIAVVADWLGDHRYFPGSRPDQLRFGRIPWDALREIGGGVVVAALIGGILLMYEFAREERIEKAAAERMSVLAVVEFEERRLIGLVEAIYGPLTYAHHNLQRAVDMYEGIRSTSKPTGPKQRPTDTKYVRELQVAAVEGRNELRRVFASDVMGKAETLWPVIDGTLNASVTDGQKSLGAAVAGYRETMSKVMGAPQHIPTTQGLAELKQAMETLRRAARGALADHRSRLNTVAIDRAIEDPAAD